MKVQPFSEHGHFTAVHNVVFDVMMPSLPANAWKVLCLILRKTVGWHKDSDAISYTEIARGTGIKSPATISAAIKMLLALDYITATEGGDWEATSYALNTKLEIEVARTTEIEVATTSKNEVARTTEIEVAPTSKNEEIKKKDTNKPKKERGAHAPTLTDHLQSQQHAHRDDRPSATPPPQDDAERPPAIAQEAIKRYQSAFGRYPNKIQAQEIAKRVTDLDGWQAILDAWQMHGWNRTNVGGMLDAYSKGGVKQQAVGHVAPTTAPDETTYLRNRPQPITRALLKDVKP